MALTIEVGQRQQQSKDYYYGVEWNVTVSNSALTRIGKPQLHIALPCQSKMRRCILKDDGSVNYYLDANNSNLRADGETAKLDGSDGQFMVELPNVYMRFEADGNIRRALMSPQPLPGFTKWSKDYISAVEATIDRTNNKLAAVVNETAQYRGGGNQSNWDALDKSQLGMPATGKSLTDFRNLARARNSGDTDKHWNCNTYKIHKKLFWLYTIEYANSNCQLAYNAELTQEGYHRGGLGNGVTTVSSGNWNSFNGYHPIVKCGATKTLGNKTGVVSYSLPASFGGGSEKVSVPSYRGVENPFGHIWKWTDGVLCSIESGQEGLSKLYVCDTPSKFSSSITADYEYRGNLPRTSGYVKTIILGEYGEIMPLSVGGGTTTYFCDYFYTAIPSSGTSTRGVLFGGSANPGAYAGFVYAHTSSSPSHSSASFGSRLCYAAIEAAA